MGKIVLKSIDGAPYRVDGAPMPDHNCRLALQLNSCGFEYRDIPAEYNWNGLERGDTDTCLLQYTISGSGKLRFEQRHYDVLPGQLMLVTIPHDHHYYLEPGKHWEHIYITCQGTEVMRLAHVILQQHGPIFPLLPHGQCMTRFAQLVRLCIDQSLDHAQEASERLYAIFMSLLNAAEHLALHPDNMAIQQAIQFGREHLAQDIGVADLSDTAGMSRFHFSRQFKQLLGVSPAHWINQQRIQMATQLLADPNLSMQDIAAQCGFNDVNYFGKVFKRLRGVSPGHFRHSGLFM